MMIINQCKKIPNNRKYFLRAGSYVWTALFRDVTLWRGKGTSFPQNVPIYAQNETTRPLEHPCPRCRLATSPFPSNTATSHQLTADRCCV